MRRLLLPVLLFISASCINAQLSVRKAGDGKYELFDPSTGAVLTSIHFDSVRSFIHGRAAVSLNRKWGFIDETGKLVIPVAFESAEDFIHQNILACNNDHCNYYDRNGEMILPEKHQQDTTKKKWKVIEMNAPGNSKQLQALNIPCPDNIDFEKGNFYNWQTNVGNTFSSAGTNKFNLPDATWLTNINTSNRQVLNDRYSTLPDVDYFGLFPVNPPGAGGRYSLQLGNDADIGVCGGNPCPDSRAEAARYIIHVPAGKDAENYSITFSYAVVLENPLSAVNRHEDYEQPRFKVAMYDVISHDTITCANFTFVASGPLPGFDTSVTKKNNDAVVKYKKWSSVYVNLSRYAGRTLNLEFITGDCTRGGHFGYAYVDVMECGIGATAQYKCDPGVATLTGPPGFQNYQWYDSSFSNLIGTGEVISLNDPIGKKYWVIATPYTNTGCPVCDCRDTVGVDLQLNYPVADAGASKMICPSTAIQIGLTAIPGYSYHWSPADGLSRTDIATPIAAPASSKEYILTVTDISTGCSAKDSIKVEIYPKPYASFSINSDKQCFNGNKFVFSNKSSINEGNYFLKWKFGDGNSSSVINPYHEYLQPGNYPVQLLAISNNGCSDSVTKNVEVSATPKLLFAPGNDVMLCKGNNMHLGVSGAQDYSWSPSQFLSCTDCADPIASPVSGVITYVVMATDSSGCPGKDSVKVTVLEPFTISASGGEICETNSVQLLANGAMLYLWMPSNSLNKADVADPVASPSATTTYTVIGYDANNCFTDTSYATVTVHPNPVIKLGNDLELASGSQHPLLYSLQNGPVTKWLWSPADLLSCTDCPSPIATIKTDMTFWVRVTNIYGCTGEDNIGIKAFCRNTQLFIPNAFTPDGDGINDVLTIQGTGISKIRSFRIFNRWGELVFEKVNFNPNDPAFSWDGKVNGKMSSSDVFVYIADVVCENGLSYLYKGNVSILK